MSDGAEDLKVALDKVQIVRSIIDSKMEECSDDILESYHYELLDVELRLKDMVNNIGKLYMLR